MTGVFDPLDLSQKLVVDDFCLDEKYNARAVAWLKTLDVKKIKRLYPGNPAGADKKMSEVRSFLKDITDIYGQQLVVSSETQVHKQDQDGPFLQLWSYGTLECCRIAPVRWSRHRP